MARGSVTRRSDGWCIRLDVGVDPETGKRRQVSRQGFRTKREAQAVLNDLLLDRELVRQPDVSAFGPTVAEFMEEWLARARVSVRESTWAAYRNAVVHLADGLGSGSLRLMSALEVERFEHGLLTSGRSAKTVANVHAVLHRALADAVRDGLVDRNVASLRVTATWRAARNDHLDGDGAEAVPPIRRGTSAVRSVRGVGDDGDAPR